MQASLIVLGLGLALPVAVVHFGWLLTKRRLDRVKLERRAAFLAEFSRDHAPQRDEVVQLLVGAGPPPRLSFGYFDPLGGWRDPDTSEPIRDTVRGWREHPFGHRLRPNALDDWTDAKVKTGLDRRFPV